MIWIILFIITIIILAVESYSGSINEFIIGLYEPEILSKYIDFVNMKMYSSSFSDKVIKEIE